MIRLDSSFVGDMVRYYEPFFLSQEKVSKEIEAIIGRIKSVINSWECCIDVGCGTGMYTQSMSNYFNNVIGIDCSADMIKYALEHHLEDNIEFIINDARCMKSIAALQADLAISLAHVVGYQLDNGSVDKYFKTINMNLKKGGILLFNFYNLSAMYEGNLRPRHVIKKEKDIEMIRISSARNNSEENCLELDYYYLIQSDDCTNGYEIHERMRYFSKLEIEYYLNRNGFEIIEFFDYDNGGKLTHDNWNGGIVARKKDDIVLL